MKYDDTTVVRDRLEQLAATAPPVDFDPLRVVARGRRARRRRTQLTVVGTAVALALVVAVPAVVLGGDDDGRRTLPATPSALPALAAQPVHVSPAEAKRIVRGCALSFAGRNGRIPSQPETGAAGGRLIQDVAKVYSVVRDRYGSAATVYAPTVVMDCSFNGDKFNAGGSIALGSGVPTWLAGAVSVDSISTAAGSVDLDIPKGQVLTTIGGRVTRAVASVVVRSSDRTFRVTPVNGTYLIRFLAPSPSDPRKGVPEIPDAPVTAYDAAGRSLGGPGQGNCYTAPDGHVVIGVRNKHWPCVPATRWG